MSSRQRVLEAVVELTSRHDESPTVRQVAEEVGLSTSVVHGHLTKLVEEGRVRAPARKGAGWRPL